MKRSNRNLLIGCGVLVLAGACVAAILTLGGFGALAAIFGPDPEGLTVAVAVEPATVAEGETFKLVITAGNEGSRPLTITGLDVPQSILDGALLTRTDPLDRGRSQLSSSLTLDYALEVPPGEQATLTLTFEALAAGDYRGDIDVVVGVRRKIASVRLVIDPSQVVDGPGILPTDIPPEVQAIPYRAVVQIIALYEENGELYEGWTGSGSIVTPDGLILTNAHVVLPDKYYPVDALIVALTEREDQPPLPAYYAEVMQADEDLDIAVIRVTADLDGQPVDPAALDLPVVPLGDSQSLRLGDRMYILGYPGIGGETITLTSGEVSGFTGEAGRGERAFIKTSATIAGGNSGGLAANDRGELIGVPTQLGYGGDGQYVDCRVLADTNRDGFIDDQDNCVPTGGFINALRPLELARPLIEAAQRGEVAVTSGQVEGVEAPSGGTILYQEDFSDPASGWDVFSNEEYSVGYENGTYQIELQVDHYYVWSVAGASFADVVVRVDAQLFAPTGVGDFGLVCRYLDENNFYALEVSEDGYFSIWKRLDGEFVTLVDWEYTDALLADGTGVTLQAACLGDTLMLAADEILLAEASDTSFSQGDIGLIAGTWETVGLGVAFDNLVAHGP